jgi:hypothetical protein
MDRQIWYDQWPLSVQIGTYSHVLYSLFDPTEVYGVEVDGAIFTKKDIKLVRVPVRKTPEGMNIWYWSIQYWLDEMDRNLDMMLHSEKENIMRAYPLSPGNCTNYMKLCPYHDFCVAWGNPLHRCDEVPLGFREYRWNPADREKEAKAVINV